MQHNDKEHNDKEVIFRVQACPDNIYMIHESVRELVRCRDCKHRVVNEHYGKKGYMDLKAYCKLDTGDIFELGRNAENDDWFCADGERKDQDFEKRSKLRNASERSKFQNALVRSIDPKCLSCILSYDIDEFQPFDEFPPLDELRGKYPSLFKSKNDVKSIGGNQNGNQ